MYSTCLFCQQKLGSNERLPTFPVGRRLAYDPATGRLWVICPRCARWNLTPLEERWEAIEDAERLYRDTRLRYSTDQIGLARLPDGLELVRIGTPARPEMAAWRYGRIFRSRRRQHLVVGGGASALVFGSLAVRAAGGMVALPTLVSGAALTVMMGHSVYTLYRRFRDSRRIVARFRTDSGYPLLLTNRHLRDAKLATTEDGWAIEIGHRVSDEILRRRADWITAEAYGGPPVPSLRAVLKGREALRAAGIILPRLNPEGGDRRTVESAVSYLDRAGAPDEAFRTALMSPVKPKWPLDPSHLLALPLPVRLALEMASHEETERAALEGELRLLEAAWREAEEIAAISDRLLEPPSVDEFIERHHRGGGESGRE